MTDDPLGSRHPWWKWSVCGLLLLATMLNYMDRQTLAQTATEIKTELKLSQEQYGELEMGFGLAFAAGAIITGLMVDKFSVRWLYPFVLMGWSLSGVATAYASPIGARLTRLLEPMLGPAEDWIGDDVVAGQAFLGLMVCRVVLGLFEAGQWPCALVTTQRILSRADRSFGNSLLQSGAAIGAIITPQIVKYMVTDEAGSWRGPFVVIGLIGMLWVIPWFAIIRRSDLARRDSKLDSGDGTQAGGHVPLDAVTFWRRYVTLVVVVIMINLTWQYFRVWLPSLLREFHEYDRAAVSNFTSAYYISTDIGCISVGMLVKYLADRGHDVHRVRLATFFACSLLTALAVIAAFMPRGPILLGIFLVVGFGALGLFPNYYSFTQELTSKHQGKITGSLGAITWIVTSIMQKYFGRWIDQTKSYEMGICLVALAPLLGCIVLWLFWGKTKQATRSVDGASE